MTDYQDLLRRLRRMSDMTTTGNDLLDIGRAADAIEALLKEREEHEYQLVHGSEKIADKLPRNKGSLKTKEEFQAAVDELRSVCNKHGIVLIATCAGEGIYGEITLYDSSQKEGRWIEPQRQARNIVEYFDYDGAFTIDGIGDFAG